MYKESIDALTGQESENIIKRSCAINTKTRNKDYQEYLEWVAAGNTIEEAD